LILEVHLADTSCTEHERVLTWSSGLDRDTRSQKRTRGLTDQRSFRGVLQRSPSDESSRSSRGVLQMSPPDPPDESFRGVLQILQRSPSDESSRSSRGVLQMSPSDPPEESFR